MSKDRGRYLKLAFSQMANVREYADSGKVLTGASLVALRRRTLHEMITLRGEAHGHGRAQNGMAWNNLAQLYRMRRRIGQPGSLLTFVAEALTKTSRTEDPARRKVASRFLRKRFPEILEDSDDLRVLTMGPRNVEAIRRRTAMTGAMLGRPVGGYPEGTPVRMDRSGRWRAYDDSLGEVVPAHAVRVARKRAVSPHKENANEGPTCS